MRLLNVFIVLAAIVLSTAPAYSQVQLPGDTVRWSAAAYIRHDGDSVDLSERSRFTFYGSAKVLWQPLDDAGVSAARGKVFQPGIYVYRVTDVAGNLPAGAATGAVTYAFTYQGKAGTLQIKKSGPVYTLHFTIGREDGTIRERDYDLSDYTILHQ